MHKRKLGALPEVSQMRGSTLNKRWGLGVRHALYRETGDWYHQLTKFPGAFFDRDGYILFKSESEYRACIYIQIQKDVHVPGGISSIPGYVQVMFDSNDNTLTQSDNSESPDNLYQEGSAIHVVFTKYERNHKARKRCVEHYGSKCQACGIELAHVYGELARGCIHVHHLVPLSDIGEQYRIDAIQDLRPVCANCHMVIHLRRPPYSIDELRDMIQQTQDST